MRKTIKAVAGIIILGIVIFWIRESLISNGEHSWQQLSRVLEDRLKTSYTNLTQQDYINGSSLASTVDTADKIDQYYQKMSEALVKDLFESMEHDYQKNEHDFYRAEALVWPGFSYAKIEYYDDELELYGQTQWGRTLLRTVPESLTTQRMKAFATKLKPTIKTGCLSWLEKKLQETMKEYGEQYGEMLAIHYTSLKYTNEEQYETLGNELIDHAFLAIEDSDKIKSAVKKMHLEELHNNVRFHMYFVKHCFDEEAKQKMFTEARKTFVAHMVGKARAVFMVSLSKHDFSNRLEFLDEIIPPEFPREAHNVSYEIGQLVRKALQDQLESPKDAGIVTIEFNHPQVVIAVKPVKDFDVTKLNESPSFVKFNNDHKIAVEDIRQSRLYLQLKGETVRIDLSQVIKAYREWLVCLPLFGALEPEIREYFCQELGDNLQSRLYKQFN